MFASPKLKREVSEVQRTYRTLRVPGMFVSYTTKGVVLRQNPDAGNQSQTTNSNSTVPRWV